VKVLVINAGSSSLKFALFEMKGRQVLAKGVVERIGLYQPKLEHESRDGGRLEQKPRAADHHAALELVCEKLVDPVSGALKDLSEVEAIGHRVVHGGETFTDPVLVDAEVKKIIRHCIPLAPLHNPANLDGIKACSRAFPGVPNVAVFDTAFHQSMPPSSYLFAIPLRYYEKYGIRKYGFHGTSHKFVYQATADFLEVPRHKVKLITCHLGNGCSIAAVRGGKVLDTTMGMTPMKGLVMGTRCGDLDPGVVLFLLKHRMSVERVEKLLNKESGLRGVSGGRTGDMRDVIAQAKEGSEEARRALAMFTYRIVSYIGAYYTILDGADAVVFTGGIGQKSAYIRKRAVAGLGVLGCRLDAKANQAVSGAALISTPDSTLKAVVMPTDEELMIALETAHVVRRQSA